MEDDSLKTIFTCFAGREDRLSLLRKYIEILMKKKEIDEVHFWNYTKKEEDENYLLKSSNVKRTSSSGEGTYRQIRPIIENNSFKLKSKAKNDLHIKISSGNECYEIVVGGYGNTKSIIRKYERGSSFSEIKNVVKKNLLSEKEYKNFLIEVNSANLIVYLTDEIIISCKVSENFKIKEVYIKTGFGSVGEFEYEVNDNKNFYFLDTCRKKPWTDYYQYYTAAEFKNSIIVKCDDDIVFIDTNKFKNFIDYKLNNECDLLFANTINNGVAAFIQQHILKLIPRHLTYFEMPENGYCGSLWKSGKKAELLHDYFLKEYNKFLNNNYQKEVIEIKTRFSINFFVYLGKDWRKIKDAGGDDEKNLTVDLVKNANFKNFLYNPFYVSHLSFGPQTKEMNENRLIEEYTKFYNTLLNNSFIFESKS